MRTSETICFYQESQRGELENACREILGVGVYSALRSVGQALPEIAKMAAIRVFTFKREEDEHTELLRAALHYLTEKGTL